MKRWSKTMGMALLLGVLAMLAACSSIALKEREQAEGARIQAYAGQPVHYLTRVGRYWGWKPISNEQALVWTTPDKGYLIKVQQPCEDLRFADRIGLTETLHTVYSGGLDYMRVRGGRCPIEEIRPVDYARLRADLRREHQMERAQAAESAKVEPKTG